MTHLPLLFTRPVLRFVAFYALFYA